MAKYCSSCGQEVHEEAVICIHCGCQVAQPMQPKVDKPSTGIKVLSLLFPLLGLNLFCIYLEDKPICAKSYGIWAFVGLVIETVLAVWAEMI